jgi:glycosyltransferase involved in cell wall biosynthesis
LLLLLLARLLIFKQVRLATFSGEQNVAEDVLTGTTRRRFSIVIPCYNEENAIRATVEQILQHVGAEDDYEIIVVDDGSDDQTPAVLGEIDAAFSNVRVIVHPSNRGYGAALKTGIRRAQSELIVITDADGTYPNERIVDLVSRCQDQDMVIGARTGANVTYSKIRSIPKFFLKHWVSWLAAQDVPDINSGLRVFRKNVAERYFRILSDKFSFTITITLAMLTNDHRVLFVPIDYHARVGKSKIQPIRDTFRFAMLVLRTGIYFAPLRAFMPIFSVLILSAIASLMFDVFVYQDLTDKTLLLFLFSLNVVMFSLLADMIEKRT